MWKRLLCCVLTVLTLLSCFGCGGKKEEVPVEEEPVETVEPEPEPEPEPAGPVNPLTGEPLEDEALVNRRPVAVMLNDIHYAMPQHGVADADMIFEFNVEGGITRMVGFYQDPSEIGVIGSVRSARACFIETVMGLDAIYFHAGASQEARGMFRSLNMDHIDGSSSVFWRDAERRKTMAIEHTLMTSGEAIAAYLDKSSFRRDHQEDYSYPMTYVEDATPVNGEEAAHVSVHFSRYKVDIFDYDPDSGLYMINQYFNTKGTVDPYIDGNTDKQVGVPNLLVLRTTVVNSGDSSGHMNIDLKGGNDGVYFCGGKAEPITWQKEGTYDPFAFYHKDGTPLSLQVGHTYVCVIDVNAELTYND